MREWHDHKKKLIDKYNKENNNPTTNKLIPRKTDHLYNMHQLKEKTMNNFIKALMDNHKPNSVHRDSEKKNNEE